MASNYCPVHEKDIVEKVTRKQSKKSQWQKFCEGRVTASILKERTDKISESFNVINPNKCKTITKTLKQKLQNGVLLMNH